MRLDSDGVGYSDEECRDDADDEGMCEKDACRKIPGVSVRLKTDSCEPPGSRCYPGTGFTDCKPISNKNDCRKLAIRPQFLARAGTDWYFCVVWRTKRCEHDKIIDTCSVSKCNIYTVSHKRAFDFDETSHVSLYRKRKSEFVGGRNLTILPYFPNFSK